MKKPLLKTILFFVFSALSINLVFAVQVTSHKSAVEKCFVIRFTSEDPRVAIPFTAQYMVVNRGSHVNNINQVTPFEIKTTGKFIGLMLQINENNPNIKVEFLEQVNNQEKQVMAGSGHGIFAHIASWEDDSYILVA